ncbi:MAG: copper resistance protein CopC [Rhodobacteraceae bacterium]|nr:copper resistance protein CopC [Paracoccaceae bacterium]
MALIRRNPSISIAVAILMAVPSAGHAHSIKEATIPADESVLTTAPDTIGMEFDTPMRVTMISLTDQDGTLHELTRNDAMEPVTDFRAQPPRLPPGIYRIDWRGMAEDGHAMQGSFRFELRD